MITIKRIKLSMLLWVLCSIVSFGQSLVAEEFYTINNIQHSALIVINGDNSGRCKVHSSVGYCWYDAYLSNSGSYMTISLSNPSTQGWVPVVFCFLADGTNYIQVQGYRFPVYGSVIPQGKWNEKMRQYGFNNISFPGKTPEASIGKKCVHNISGNHKYSNVKKCDGFANRPSDRVTCINCGCSYEAH